MRFHPCGHPTDERIGVLAVTTAQQDALVFTLPYLNSNSGSSPAVLQLEPTFICRLAEEPILYQDAYLLQMTSACWHYQKGHYNMLVAGYVNGFVAIWNFEGKSENEDKVRHPDILIPAHHESVTAVDMKAGNSGQIYLLTACLGREIKLFSIENVQYQEVFITNPTSRTLCAQLFANWPSFVIGNDNAFALGVLVNRQPFDFGTKNTTLMNVNSTIIDLDVNQWTNTVILSTDAGDVLACTPHQLLNSNPKDKWHAYDGSVVSFTDYKKIPQSNGAPYEVGIVFADLKVRIVIIFY